MNIKFSIITVCFNSKNTIERTIKSVLAQTYDDYEYIIIDGASKDGTLDIVKGYESLFNGKMLWNSEPDEGIYDAMNKGIKKASGDIVGIVNSDDWLEPNALEIVKECVLENADNVCIYTGGIRFISNQGWSRELMPDIKKFEKKVGLYIMAGIRHPATFVPKLVYDKIGLFDKTMTILADTDFIVRAHYSGIHFCPIYSVLSNMADGGASNGDIHLKVSQKALSDKKKMLDRYNLSPLRYRYVLTRWKIMHYVRTLAKKIKIYRVR